MQNSSEMKFISKMSITIVSRKTNFLFWLKLASGASPGNGVVELQEKINLMFKREGEEQ